jgi:predicted transcriptional regulator of viral defense system
MENNGQFISSSSVKGQGRTKYYKMLEKAKQGELIQVRRGVYATSEQLSRNMVDINAIVPDGILCLWSAWNIHRLTTSMPQAFHIAVKRDRKVTVPSFPQMEIHYYTDKVLNIGVSNITIDSINIRVYDIERCVCDAVKFRNKVGIDVCSEIINNYLEHPERNISKLMDYAKILRVSAILGKYLEVKL